MNVLAINSSLRRGGQSKTELMLDHLVEGMRQAGAEVEIVHLRDKEVNYCIGCFGCMTKTPGKCGQQDDMTAELFPKWLESDLVVYATPLFHHTVNAPMKTFIERTFPVCEPFLDRRDDGRWVHPLRQKPPSAVLLSVCGFPEESAFGALSHYMNFLFGESLLAEIYRPGAEALIQQKDILDDVLDATVQAGRELIESRCVQPETMGRIKQPLFDDVGSFARIANLAWQTCIAEGLTLAAFNKKGMVPRPDSVENFMRVMPLGFNPAAASDVEAVLQFTFSSEVEGACYFTIVDGKIETALGIAEEPDLTIKAPFKVWMDIITGKADGAQMFMQGAYAAEGDTSLLTKIDRWFSSGGGNGPDGAATPAEENETMKPVTLTCRAIIAGMPTVFNPDAAGDMETDIYFKVGGEEPGDYYLRIADGKCMFHEGAPASPQLTIETPSEVWAAISRGELDGQQAFLQQKYKAVGDAGLLMKLNDLFNDS